MTGLKSIKVGSVQETKLSSLTDYLCTNQNLQQKMRRKKFSETEIQMHHKFRTEKLYLTLI